jgi:hypothetical protein
MTIPKILAKLIGEARRTPPQGFKSNVHNAIWLAGYNQALQDITKRLPDTEAQINELIKQARLEGYSNLPDDEVHGMLSDYLEGY